MMKKIFAIIILCLAYTVAQQNIAGVKLYPEYAEFSDNSLELYLEKTAEMKASGFNYIFTTPYNSGYSFYESELIPQRSIIFDITNFVKALRENGLKFAAVCQIFHDPASYEFGSYFRPVDSRGDSTQSGWQKFICPADTACRNYKLSIINEILLELNPDMISLDFIRYPLEWEMISGKGESDGREFCFCKNCLIRFKEYAGFEYPAGAVTDSSKTNFILTEYYYEYNEWREEVTTSFVQDVNKLIIKNGSSAELSVHVLPWTGEMYEGALRYSGQSIEALAETADYLSPMLYLDMLKMESGYISEYAEHYSSVSGARWLPALQVPYSDRTSIDTENLHQQISSVMEDGAEGFVLFHYNDIFMRDDEGESKMRTIMNDVINK